LGKLFPARESLVSDIPAGDGNTAKPFFYSVLGAGRRSSRVIPAGDGNTAKLFFTVYGGSRERYQIPLDKNTIGSVARQLWGKIPR